MSVDAHRDRRADRLRQLSQTAPDSEMGKLLRRFWQPVALSSEVAAGAARPLRAMGEDLTLYRGESGRPYLVAARCAHRLTVLHTGWVEGEHIRCMYHGWQYDGTGQCTHRPAERDTGLPNVTIAGYPLTEYAGILFAYLGEGEPPPFDLPRKDVFERPGGVIHARRQVWDCNWFQMIENSLDAVHVSFVHAYGQAGRFIDSVTQTIPELEYTETAAGIRQTATRGPGNVRVSDWTFPNNNHITLPGPYPGDPWIDVGAWMVPVDDGHGSRITLYAAPAQGDERDERLLAYLKDLDYNPADHHDELLFKRKLPADGLLGLTYAQDYIAQRGQGEIADRASELLGRSDAGVAFLRRLFFRELEALRNGEPTTSWRRLDEAAHLPVQGGARS